MLHTPITNLKISVHINGNDFLHLALSLLLSHVRTGIRGRWCRDSAMKVFFFVEHKNSILLQKAKLSDRHRWDLLQLADFVCPQRWSGCPCGELMMDGASPSRAAFSSPLPNSFCIVMNQETTGWNKHIKKRKLAVWFETDKTKAKGGEGVLG